MNLIDDLESKARTATPGPWRAVSSLPVWAVCATGEWGVWDIVTATGREYARHAHADKHGSKQEDAEYIAAANPEAILRLIAAYRELEGACDITFTSENDGTNCRNALARAEKILKGEEIKEPGS